MSWKPWVLLGCVTIAGLTFLAYAGPFKFSEREPAGSADGAGRVASNGRGDESARAASANAESSGSFTNILPEDDRKFIWDIEHIALILDVHAFPRVAKTLREADRAGFAAFLSDDFTGSLLDESARQSASYPFGEFNWIGDPGDAKPPASADDFAGYVMSQRARFAGPTKAEVRLMRLSPVDHHDLKGAWQGTMKIRIAGERSPGQPSEVEMQARFTLEDPPDDIADRTQWLKSCRLYSWREQSSTHLLMRDVAAERGIDPHRFHDNWDFPDKPPLVVQGGVYLTDFDRDGSVDVLVKDVNGTALFQNQGDGNFKDVTQSSGLAKLMQRHAVPSLFADFDGDGYEDLISGTQIFSNNRDGTFSDVTPITNLRLPANQGAFAVADYDLDGLLDLYVVRASPGPMGRSRVSWVDDQTGPGNQLWRNLGNWRFKNVTEAAGASAGHRSCFAAVWLDANSDGRPDIAASDEFGSSVLLINGTDGKFTERILKEPFGGFCMGLAAGDYDNDGHIDIYLANMFSKAGDRIIANLPTDAYSPDLRAKIKQFVVGSELLHGNGDGSFSARGQALNVNGVGWAYGPNFVDLDNDGWLDIVAPAGFLSYTRGEPDG